MRHLHGHLDRSPAELLEAAASWCRERDVKFDNYGVGAVLADLEQRVAALLGFEAARFFPSGTMAQPAALRIWADRAGTRHVGMHPTAHVELHEERGYMHLWGLTATLVGPRDRPLLAEHLAAVPERLAALLVELPIREVGGQLPSLDELRDLKTAAAARGVRLHLDGARLWECGPAYDRPYDEICAGFDSAYVSFYKGVGALSGAMLLGDTEFIAEAKVWQRRAGGNLFTLLPNVVTASMQLEERLARMPRWLAHAKRLAAAIGAIDGVRVLPDPPHVNLFHVFMRLDAAAAHAARDRVAQQLGIRVFSRARPADVPGWSRTELYIGEAAMEVTPEEAAAGFAELLA